MPVWNVFQHAAAAFATTGASALPGRRPQKAGVNLQNLRSLQLARRLTLAREGARPAPSVLFRHSGSTLALLPVMATLLEIPEAAGSRKHLPPLRS